MKNRILRDWSLGLVLAVLPVVGSGAQEVGSQAGDPAPTQTQPSATNALIAPPANDPTEAAAEQAEANLAKAPVQTISGEKPLPPNVKPSAAVMDVVRLADSSVDPSVLVAYVNNSTSSFNLGAEDIIYLNDVGIPGNVVTAMIQHDSTLKAGAAPNVIAPLGTYPSAPSAPAPPVAPPSNEFASDAVPPPDASGQYAPVPDGSAPPPVEIAPGAVPADYADESDGPPPAVANDSAFYDSLAPYGNWVNVGGYGNCWQPSVAIMDPNWQPYFNGGRWVYSDCGWYWLSGYSWGWAPFHYGRWFRHGQLGWCWSPGTVWGPSWVAWRYSGGYCGWAPLPPGAWYRAGVGLTYCGRPVSAGFGFGLTPSAYAFVSFNHFYNNHLPNYAVPHKEVNGFYARTTFSTGIGFSNHRVVNNGLPPRTVASITHMPVRQVSIHNVSRTTGNEGGRVERFGANGAALSVFRPTAPQAAGSKASMNSRSAGAARGGAHSYYPGPNMGSPIILHGSDRPTSAGNTSGNASGTSHAPSHATSWKDFPRSNSGSAVTTDAASYQRWQQRVQPSPTPWYLPNASSSASRTTEKTSRSENRQELERQPYPKNSPGGNSRYERPVNNLPDPRPAQHSVSKQYDVPRSEYTVPPSAYAARQEVTAPSYSRPVEVSRPAVSQPRTVEVAPSYVAPVHSAPSQPAASSASGGQAHSSGGSGGRGWR